MPDVFTRAKRSEVMSRISSRGNERTELALARVFRAEGITGWRRQVPIRIAERGTRKSTSPRPSPQSGEGEVFRVRPDFVFPKRRVAVFVDGCFWHGCPRHGTQPKGNAAFWRRKFAANIARDRRVNRALRKAGWRVLRIWEHDLRKVGMRKSERGMKRRGRSPLTPTLSAGGGEGGQRAEAEEMRWRFDTSPSIPLPVRGGEGGAHPWLVARLRRELAG
mgnify:FL=1